jgi:CMP-N-acetylneuraminic acid synthetase
LIELAGLNLVQRAVKQASDSNLFDHIIVSTDYSEEVIKVASSLLVSIHTRSPEASSDTSTANDVLRDLFTCIQCKPHFENASLCYLQPTSPLRTSRDILDSYKFRDSTSKNRVIATLNKPVFKSKLVDFDVVTGRISENSTLSATSNRQEASGPSLIPNGAIYWFEHSDWIETKSFPIDGAKYYAMPWSRSIDIDSMEDLEEVLGVLGMNHE